MGTPELNLFDGRVRTVGGLTIPHEGTLSVSEWIGKLTIAQGSLAGQPFNVLPWQRAFIESALAPGIQQAALSVGRGNGKTTLVAALAGAFIDGPLRQPKAEVPVVAASYAQARIAFEHVRNFLDQRLFPRAHWRVTDSINWSLIEHRPTGARLRVVSSNPKRAHGLAPALVICDEPAQWQVGDGERMYSALVTSLGKIPDSRLIALGTRPSDTNHWFARLLETKSEGVVAHCYASDPDDDIFARDTWLAANPSMPYMPHLEKAIALEAAQCRNNPTMVPAFRALRLNQGVRDSDSVQALVELSDWKRCAAKTAEAAGPTVWGIDLGGTKALSAVACYWPETFRLDSIAEVGCEPTLVQRGITDGVHTLYQQAEDAGELHVSESRIPSTTDLLRRALDRWGAPAAIVADRWRVAELRDAHERLIPSSAVVTRGQGFKDGADDVRRFRAAVALSQVVPCQRLFLLDSGVLHAVVTLDAAGNAKLAKLAEGGRKTKLRDDVAAAAILAVGYGSRARDAMSDSDSPRSARSW